MHSLLLLIILKDESFGACEVKYPNGQDKSGTGAKLTHPGSVVPCRASMLSPTNDAGQETADIESLNIALLAYLMWQMAGHPTGQDIQFWLETEARLSEAGDEPPCEFRVLSE